MWGPGPKGYQGQVLGAGTHWWAVPGVFRGQRIRSRPGATCQARKAASVVRLSVQAPRGGRGGSAVGAERDRGGSKAREPTMVDVEWDGALELITLSVGGPTVMGVKGQSALRECQ